jgi:hypothetical protein
MSFVIARGFRCERPKTSCALTDQLRKRLIWREFVKRGC